MLAHKQIMFIQGRVYTEAIYGGKSCVILYIYMYVYIEGKECQGKAVILSLLFRSCFDVVDSDNG